MDSATLAQVMLQPGRATRAIVDLDAIENNLKVVKSLISPSQALMAVVKANAYGHGAIPVARAALAAGATHLGVAMVDEAIELRLAGIDAPVLVLGPSDESEIEAAIRHRIELAVGDPRFVHAVTACAERLDSTQPVPVHLKVDTGMHRFGVPVLEAVAAARAIAQSSRLRLQGVFTHYARADEVDAAPTRRQAAIFEELLEQLHKLGITPELTHAANSAAILRPIGQPLSLVRLGIAMYGLNPSMEAPVWQGMTPAMTIVSKIVRVIELQPGDEVSYGGAFRATAPCRAALVPIGYADGYPRTLSNVGSMLIEGEPCAVIGRVCMDQTIVQLPDACGAEVNDLVIVTGSVVDRKGVIELDELALRANTINYEIATRITARVPRFYVREGQVVGVSRLTNP